MKTLFTTLTKCNYFFGAFFIIFSLTFPETITAQNVGINGTGAAPNTSAMLDVSAPDKGMLVPRVNLISTTDVTTIASPTVSLLAYNTNTAITGSGANGAGFYYYTGTRWASLATIGSGGFTHYLGEDFNGGIIFYLYKGSDGLEHGLIVSKTESTARQWQSVNSLVNADRTEDGAYNTTLMTSSPAATYIATLGAGWYLPSVDELGLLFINRFTVQAALRAGGFTLLSRSANYWSSTEQTTTQASGFFFGYGYSSSTATKNSNYIVRGVRAF